jgi:segregation and condensation protein A
MPIDDYIVRLDQFEGPMDLLLHLIRKAEVDIHDIPIATIADQYLQRLTGIDDIDIEQAGEFLVMAATLMEIKARMISPPARPEAEAGEAPEPGGISESADPRAELVQQLLAYKRFRDAADALDTARFEWQRRFPAAPIGEGRAEPEPEDDDAPVDLEDLQLFDLVEAFARIIATVDLDRAIRGAHEVSYDDTPIELHAEDILDRLRRSDDDSGRISLRRVVAERPRGEVIGLFLALLELIRRRAVTVRSLREQDDIEIALVPVDQGVGPVSPGASAGMS